MIRVLGGPGDPATRLENRAGEPAANPYLYIMSQIVAGLDGIDHAIDPGPANDEPYAGDRAAAAEEPHGGARCARARTGVPHPVGRRLRRLFPQAQAQRAGRFLRWLEEHGKPQPGEETTIWEQNEYFDFF